MVFPDSIGYNPSAEIFQYTGSDQDGQTNEMILHCSAMYHAEQCIGLN